MKKINIPIINAIDENDNNAGIVFKSIIKAYVLSLVLLATFAAILTYTSFSESSIPIAVMVVSIISILYASKCSAKKAKSRGWLIGSITGFTYMFILYLISLVFIERPVFDMHVLLIWVVGLISGAIGGIIGINLKKPEKRLR